MLSEAKKEAVATFADHFENAAIGLQLTNPDLPTITATQYAVLLGAALYAAQEIQAEGLSLPELNEKANFSDFLKYAAGHYAEQLTVVAIKQAEHALEKVAVDKP